MSALERAEAHFRAQLAEEPSSIEVPEWGEPGSPLVIYWRPVNLQTKDRIFQKAAQGSLESLVTTLILRARDVDGAPLFREADRLRLMKHVDPDVIARIVTAMNAVQFTVEDAVKN